MQCFITRMSIISHSNQGLHLKKFEFNNEREQALC